MLAFKSPAKMFVPHFDENTAQTRHKRPTFSCVFTLCDAGFSGRSQLRHSFTISVTAFLRGNDTKLGGDKDRDDG